MASSMVICTFLSAPMMFMSAQMIAINKDFAEQLKKFGFDLSIVSLIASLWILFVFIVTKKYKRMPHRLTLCLIVSQVRFVFYFGRYLNALVRGVSCDFSLYRIFVNTNMIVVSLSKMSRVVKILNCRLGRNVSCCVILVLPFWFSGL